MRLSWLVILATFISNSSQLHASTFYDFQVFGGYSFIDVSVDSRDFLVRGAESSDQGFWDIDANLPTVGAGFDVQVDHIAVGGSVAFTGVGGSSGNQFFLNSVAGEFEEQNVGTGTYEFDSELKRLDAELYFGLLIDSVRARLGGVLAITDLERDGDFTPLEEEGGVNTDLNSTLRLIEYGPSVNLGVVYPLDEWDWEGSRMKATVSIDGRVSWLISELDIDFDEFNQLDVDSDGDTLGLGVSLGINFERSNGHRIGFSLDGDVYNSRQDNGPNVETRLLRATLSYRF